LPCGFLFSPDFLLSPINENDLQILFANDAGEEGIQEDILECLTMQEKFLFEKSEKKVFLIRLLYNSISRIL
jgi:hypothetical protein